MRSLELTLSDEADLAIRQDWARLEEAGLPNLGRHRSESNRPHVTMAAGPELEPIGDLGAVADAALPLELTTSGLLLFGAGPRHFVLVRAIVVTEELIALHRALAERVSGALPTAQPGAWTPHLTLARRLAPEQVARALEILDPAAPPLLAGACRWWDGDVKEVREVSSPATVE